MNKIKKFTLFLLVLILGFSLASCNDDKKYDITDVAGAKDVVIRKAEKLLTFTVENEISKFDTSNIKVSTGKAVVYGNKECKDELNTLDLSEGENTFYLKIRLDKKNKLLKKIVWKLVITREAGEKPEPPIIETTLNKEKYHARLASMAAVFESGDDKGINYEKALAEILDSEKNLEIFDYIIEGMEKAGLTDEKASATIDLIKQKFIGRITDIELENLVDAIADIAKRGLSIVKDIDGIITSKQLGIIVHTYYVNSTIDKAEREEILSSLKGTADAADYEKIVETLNEASSTLLSQDEFVDLFKKLFTVLKVIANMSEAELNAIGEIIDLASNTEDISKLEIKESDIKNINQVGNVLTRLSNVLNKEMLNEIVALVVRLMAVEEDNPVKLAKMGYISLIGNLPATLKFVSSLLSSLTLDSFNALKAVIMSLVAGLPEESALEEFGKNLVESCNLIGSAYTKLTSSEQLEIKDLIKKAINMIGVSIDIDTDLLIDQIVKIKDTSGTLQYKELATEFTKVLTTPLKTKLQVSVEEEIIIKQNSSLEALIAALNSKVKVNYLTYNKESGDYDELNKELTKENIVSYELSKGGVQKVTIRVGEHTSDIFYYVKEENPQYALSPDNPFILTDVFVYDLDGTLYIKEYTNESFVFRFINKNTYGVKEVEILVKDIQIIKPDYATVGEKNGIAVVSLENGVKYYIAVKYFTVYNDKSEVTDVEVNSINDVYQNGEQEVSGMLKITRNNGITLLTDNKWNYNNFEYINFIESNVTGLDKTKAGKQTITITVDKYTVTHEIQVISELESKNVTYLGVYTDDTYFGYPDYEELIRVSVSFINGNKYYYSGSYKKLDAYFKEKNLQYDIELILGNLKVGTNNCTLKLTNKETGQITESNFDLNLVDKDEYDKVTELSIYIKDNFFVGYTVDEILKKVGNVEYGTEYYKEYLNGEDAYAWLVQNVGCEIKASEGKLVFTVDSAKCEIDGVFSVTKDMVNINYKINNDFIPSFFNDFTEDEIMRFLITRVEVENANIGYCEEDYALDIFTRIGSIQKTATTVDVKIGTEVLRSFTLEEIKPESFTIYYSFNETLFVKKGVDQTDYILSKMDGLTLTCQKDGEYFNASTYNFDTLKSIVESGLLTITPDAAQKKVLIAFAAGNVTFSDEYTNVIFYDEAESKNVASVEAPCSIIVLQNGKDETLDKALENTTLSVRYFDGTEAEIFGDEVIALINAGKLTAVLKTNYVEFTYIIDETKFHTSVDVYFYDLNESTISGENTYIYFSRENYNPLDPYQAINEAYINITTGKFTDQRHLARAAAIKFAKEYCNLTCVEKNGEVEYTYEINGARKSDILVIK